MMQVVIPTMGLCPKEIFKYTLEQMEISNSVEKIIIIDNSDDMNFKNNFKITPKIELIENGKNIYVNPAWNIGIEKVDSQFYMILNDDIAVHHYIFNVVDSIMKNDNELGLLTVKTHVNMNIEEYKNKIDKIYKLKPKNEFTTKMLNPQGIQGWLMVGRKADWKPIPEEIKIWFGDNYIFNKCRKSGKKVLNLSSYFVNHFTSSTVSTKISPEIREQIEKIIRKEVELMKTNGNIILGK